MCVPDSQYEQALRWMFEGAWNMLESNAPQYDVEFLIGDIVHMENLLRGKYDGYSPEVIPADYVLKF